MERDHMTREELLQQLALIEDRYRDLESSYKTLKESEERYRNFIDAIDESCYEVDLEGRFIFVNEKLALNAGTTKDRILGKSFRGRFLPEDVHKITTAYGECYRTGRPVKNLIYRYMALNDEIRVVENSGSLIRNVDGKPVGFRGITRDITEREQQIRDLERYKIFVNNVEDACFELDLQGKYLFFNDAACRLRDRSREEMNNAGSLDDLSPEMSDRLYRLYNQIYGASEAEPLLEYDFVTKNGEVKNVQASVSLIRDADGKPAGFRGISRDVTEKRKKEKELARYRTFFESIEDSIFELDLSGKFTFFNEATCRNLEYSAEELRSLPYGIRYASQEEADEAFKIYNEVYRTGTSAKIYAHKTLTKSGTPIYYDISIYLIRDPEGKPVGFRCISRDITERRQLEQEHEQLQKRLTHAEKLESIGTLAGGIAHEFNNLLMGIQGYTSLIMMDTDEYHPHYEMLKAIETQIKNGADLTKQLLGYAQGGRYVVSATNLNDLAGKTLSMYARTKREIRVHEKYEPDLWKVHCDQGQIEQVLLNLFLNAGQAMPGGGTLYLETSNIVLDEDYVKNFNCKPGYYVKISITDTGMGMDVKTKQRIFEPFFTTREMGRGAGLGLASTYGVIKGHNGIINVYSEKGRGTTFNIYLPVTDSEEIKAAAPVAQIPTLKGTILIVDDEKAVRDVTSALIKRLGYHTIIAESGEEAIAIYRTNRERIDLVIMDMIMPDISGGEAIDRIRTINPDVKVILSSGYSLNGEAEDILDRGGAQLFIQKPFQVKDLSDKIEELLKR